MDKNDILDYVTKTPGNTNRAVLGGMLDSFAGGGSGGDSNVIIVQKVTETIEGQEIIRLEYTWQELHDFMENGKLLCFIDDSLTDSENGIYQKQHDFLIIFGDDGFTGNDPYYTVSGAVEAEPYIAANKNSYPIKS